jgi:hypothetical protein
MLGKLATPDLVIFKRYSCNIDRLRQTNNERRANKSLDQIWLLSRGLRSLRFGQPARQYLAYGSAAKLVNSDGIYSALSGDIDCVSF